MFDNSHEGERKIFSESTEFHVVRRAIHQCVGREREGGKGGCA